MGITCSSTPLPKNEPVAVLYDLSVTYHGRKDTVAEMHPHKRWETLGDMRRWLLTTFHNDLLYDGVAGADLVNKDDDWDIALVSQKHVQKHLPMPVTSDFATTFSDFALLNEAHNGRSMRVALTTKDTSRQFTVSTGPDSVLFCSRRAV